MKREARILLTKATDSVLLAIEHFNRPWNRGRHEAVLVLIDRAFELILKSIIIHKGGRIRERCANETIGFHTCVRKCVSDAQLKCLTEEETITVQIIHGFRGAAQHYILEVSEQQLYLFTQAGLTLFDKLLGDIFRQKLTDFLPERILPISSNPPRDFGSLMDVEFDDIKKLVSPGSRRRFRAKARLRSFGIIEASLRGSTLQPGENELGKLVQRVAKGEGWQDMFPGIRSLTLDTEGNGLKVTLRITKTKAKGETRGEPIQLVPEGTPGATIVGVKRVDELGYYSLNLTAIVTKIGLTMPKALAVVKYLKLQDDPEYFKEFTIDSTHFKRYSAKALDRIKRELPNLDMGKIWNEHKPYGRKKAGSV